LHRGALRALIRLCAVVLIGSEQQREICVISQQQLRCFLNELDTLTPLSVTVSKAR
jgi:hypothetical protein